MLDYINAYLGCYRKYFKFSGRSGRKEFGVFFVITQVIGAILVALVFELGFPPIITTIFAVYVFFTVIPAIAVKVRRLHDLNLSGWWYFGCLIYGNVTTGIIAKQIESVNNIAGLIMLCIVGILIVYAVDLYLIFTKGTSGVNRFDVDKKTNKLSPWE